MAATDIAITLVILLIGSGVAIVPVAPAAASGIGSSLRTDSSTPALSVNPPEERVWSGNTTALWAAWTDLPSGCTDSPLWFRWSLVGGFTEGSLDSVSGPTTNFTADAEGSGVAVIEAQSELLLACGAANQPVLQTATATVEVDAPLELENLTISPNPIPPGSIANLSVIVANGEPPYRMHVDWGDGTTSNVSVPDPGPISIDHRYSEGWFVPTVLLEDSTGVSVEAHVEESLSSTSGPAVGILPRTTVAEAGVPMVFSIAILRPPPNYVLVSQCAELPAQAWMPDLLGPGASSFNCTFQRPGLATVELHLESPRPYNQTFAQARLSEPVVAHLGLAARPAPVTAEVGLMSNAAVNVSGGVAPCNISWTYPGNSSRQEMTVNSDGWFDLPFWPEHTGVSALSIRVLDAAGETVTNGSAPVVVDSPLAVTATISRTLAPAGATVSVIGNITGGSPTFIWCIVPSHDPPGAAVGIGASTVLGSFSWNGTFDQSGSLALSVVVVDGSGATWTEESDASLVPPLNVTERAWGTSNASGQFLDLDLSIAGGVPPFLVNLSATNGEQWSVIAPSDGTFSWSFATNVSGPIGALLQVRDLLADVWTATLNLVIPSTNNSSGPPPSPPPIAPPDRGTGTIHGPTDSWLAGLGIACVAAIVGLGLLLRWWRRRSAGDPAPTGDPVAVVRRIVEPAEGAERSTVELLAEEAGIPLGQVRETIDRLIAEGTLRAETGEDGEEVLAWSEPS